MAKNTLGLGLNVLHFYANLPSLDFIERSLNKNKLEDRGMFRSLIRFFLLVTVSISGLANTISPLEGYHQLQKLKVGVRNTYSYSLIVDHDMRAREKMLFHLAQISIMAKRINQSSMLGNQLANKLSKNIDDFSQSARLPTIQYFQSAGLGTSSKGYLIYSNLIDQIELAMKTFLNVEEVPARTAKIFEAVNKVMTSMEMHAERALASSRSELFTQEHMAQICDAVGEELDGLTLAESDMKVVEKVKLRWIFIEDRVCDPSTAKAPFSIAYYGGLIVTALEKISSKDLVDKGLLATRK